MGFWGRVFGTEPVSVVYPHAIVNLNVSDEALALMPRVHETPEGFAPIASSDVLRDVTPPRPVLYLSAKTGLTETQARIVAHELSHLTAKLLGVPDRTHETDGGRL